MTRLAAFAATLFALSLATPAGAEPPTRLTLAQAVSIAAAQSPGVSLAQLRTQEASARVGQTRAALAATATM